MALGQVRSTMVMTKIVFMTPFDITSYVALHWSIEGIGDDRREIVRKLWQAISDRPAFVPQEPLDRMSVADELYVSVDVETAGPIPGVYSLLSIGACDVYKESQRFHCKLKPLNDNFIPEAISVSGLSLEDLRIEGVEPMEAMRQFSAWLDSICQPGQRLIFVGLNAPFDWSFVNYYLHRYRKKNPFGFTALDIKALYMGATGCSWADTGASKISKSVRATRSGNHDALEDAFYQAELFRLVRSTLM